MATNRVVAPLAVVALAAASYAAVTLTETGTESSPTTVDLDDVPQLLRHLATDERPARRPEAQPPDTGGSDSFAVRPEPRSDPVRATITSSGGLVHGPDDVTAWRVRLGGVPVPGTYAVSTDAIPHRVVATLRPPTANGTVAADVQRDVIVDSDGPDVVYTVLVRTYDGGGHPADRSFRLVIR